MRNSNRRPNWWTLYAVAALFILVFFLEAAIPFSESVRRSLEITIVLLFYGLVWMWLGINDRPLMQEDRQRERRRKLRVHKVSAANPAPLVEPPTDGILRVPGVLKMVAAWVVMAALTIYRFFLP
jgi:energy-coupling factor transporter transmembrane protein EcfT